MGIKIHTPTLKKYIGKKVKVRKRYSGIFFTATIHEIFNRQINFGFEWISFTNISSIETIDEPTNQPTP